MARQITEQAVSAFMAGRNFKLSNTKVHSDCTGVYMYLFGNLIAKRCASRISVSLAGWNSNTTRERLRGLGASVTTKKGVPYITIRGEEIPMKSREFYQITEL